jgi:hypothetical protein
MAAGGEWVAACIESARRSDVPWRTVRVVWGSLFQSVQPILPPFGSWVDVLICCPLTASPLPLEAR